MNKEVKRYEPASGHDSVMRKVEWMRETDGGGWVSWDDYGALLAERDRLREALEQIAAGERIVVRSDGHSEVSEVENDMTIDYPGIAKEALAALQGAQP